MTEEIGSSSYNPEEEPEVTSSDPNERKLARRLRIQRRLENIRKQQVLEEEETEESSKSLLQQQLQQSAETLEKLIIEGEENVTNVRISNDAREVDRRESEGVGREKIIAKLQEEADAAQEMLDEITSKWAGILKSSDPLEMSDELFRQNEKCLDVIKQKDAIITMLKDELKAAEKNFCTDQRKQVDDITILTQRIERQIILMRCAYRKELELLEEAIMMERKMLIDANEKKWEDLFKKREQEEEGNLEKKLAQIKGYTDRMTQLRKEFEEKYRETKITLENDISNIQRELERIKALSLINSEKLDYNYQILKKREDENIIIKSQQKRRINKLQDVINSLRGKISDVEKNQVTMVDKLSEDIKKLHRCILDIEAKADHFAKINNDKYRQVWELNENIIKNLLKRILDTDRLLFEQQLGIKWDNQKQRIMDVSELPSYKKAMKIITEDEKIAKSIKQAKAKDKELKKDAEQTKDTYIYRRILKHIMNQISDRSDFLIEERLKLLLELHSEEEKTLVRVDNIFSALNITKKTDIDLLMNVFLPYTYCPICADSESRIEELREPRDVSSDGPSTQRLIGEKPSVALSIGTASEIKQIIHVVQEPADVIEEIVTEILEEGKGDLAFTPQPIENLEGECTGPAPVNYQDQVEFEADQTSQKEPFEEKTYCQFQHPLMIRKVYVLKALKQFIAKYYVGKEGLFTMDYRLSHKRNTISRLLREDDISFFWSKLASVYSKEMEQLWAGLFEGLKKYHDILKDRKNLSEEVMSLRRENQDLRRILELHLIRNTKLKATAEDI